MDNAASLRYNSGTMSIAQNHSTVDANAELQRLRANMSLLAKKLNGYLDDAGAVGDTIEARLTNLVAEVKRFRKGDASFSARRTLNDIALIAYPQHGRYTDDKLVAEVRRVFAEHRVFESALKIVRSAAKQASIATRRMDKADE